MVIETSLGPLDDSVLVKREHAGVIEYFYNGQLVHRSVAIRLAGVQSEATAKL